MGMKMGKKRKERRGKTPVSGNHIKTTRRTRRLKISSGLYIAPSFLGVMLFFILPFMVVIYYSLIDNPISANFVLFDNFKGIMGNTSFRTAVRNTFTDDGAGSLHCVDLAGTVPL